MLYKSVNIAEGTCPMRRPSSHHCPSIPEVASTSLSQIKEAKELLDMGAITQEEFDEIKRKALNQL